MSLRLASNSAGLTGPSARCFPRRRAGRALPSRRLPRCPPPTAAGVFCALRSLSARSRFRIVAASGWPVDPGPRAGEPLIEVPGRSAPASPVRVDAAAGAVLAPVLLCAWTFPEHRDISAAALERLTPARQDVLRPDVDDGDGRAPAPEERLHHAARRVRRLVSRSRQLAGHRRRPLLLAREPPKDVVVSPWVMDVSRVAADLRRDLAQARNENVRLDAWALSNLKLEVGGPPATRIARRRTAPTS